MTDVLFYHLERANLESVLPGLLEKALARGWKSVVRCGSAETVKRLDDVLWTFNDESFLPHSADAARGAGQPIFLTEGEGVPNAADLLFLVDDARADAGELSRFTRCVTIFNGADEAAVSNARAFWTGVKAAGHEATYWKQSREGRWEKEA